MGDLQKFTKLKKVYFGHTPTHLNIHSFCVVLNHLQATKWFDQNNQCLSCKFKLYFERNTAHSAADFIVIKRLLIFGFSFAYNRIKFISIWHPAQPSCETNTEIVNESSLTSFWFEVNKDALEAAVDNSDGEWFSYRFWLDLLKVLWVSMI